MKSIFVSLALAFSTAAVAGYYTGKIQTLEFGPLYGDIIYVALQKAPLDKPGCVTNSNGYYFAFDSGTKIGEKIFSTLLAAQRGDSEVRIRGTGTCTVSPEVEDIYWIQSR